MPVHSAFNLLDQHRLDPHRTHLWNDLHLTHCTAENHLRVWISTGHHLWICVLQFPLILGSGYILIATQSDEFIRSSQHWYGKNTGNPPMSHSKKPPEVSGMFSMLPFKQPDGSWLYSRRQSQFQRYDRYDVLPFIQRRNKVIGDASRYPLVIQDVQ